MNELHEDTQEVRDRIFAVQARITDACQRAARAVDEVQLVAVSKFQPLHRLEIAYEAGLRDFGENYLQSMEERIPMLPDDVRWHFIGHIQSKKAKGVAHAYLVHSLETSKVAKIWSKQRNNDPEAMVRALLAVNISRQSGKSGVLPEEAEARLLELREIEGVSVEGLMCIPDPAIPARVEFARLRELRDLLRRSTELPLPHLSMGMSDSFEDAILEGATLIRVGTSLFGPRPQKAKPQESQ